MTLLVALPAVSTTPGVEVTSPDGHLTAVVHAGFPGVLLRVREAGREATVWRGDGAEWAQVRSGAPVTLSQGEGFAYDAEVAPGAAYVFALDTSDPASAVAVRLAPYAECEAWLKHCTEPSLSLRLSRAVMRPWGAGDEMLSAEVTLSDGSATGTVSAASMLSGSAVLRTRGRAEWARLVTLLRAPGVLLLQASDAHALDAERGLYMTRGRRSPEFLEAGGYGIRDTTIDWRQWARPWPGDAPLRIPGWDWATSTLGLTDAASYAAVYPTTWAQLKAGIGGWSQ